MKTNDPNNPVKPIEPTAAQLAQRKVFLHVLAPLLPYGTTVQHRAWGRGILMGLPLNHVLEQSYAEVKFEIPPPDEVTSRIVDLDDVKPVLYPFSVLGHQADSFRRLSSSYDTMVELATAFNGSKIDELVEGNYSEGQGRSRIWLQYENEEGDFCDVYLWDDGSATDPNGDAVQMIDWLRERHYAVGLKTEQYYSF